MPNLSDQHELLQRELAELGEQTMLLEQLDGFIAGLLMCPELISPGEWLPVIWNQDIDRRSPFDDADHANFVFALVMDHYNDVVLTLMNHPERYRPLIPVDHRNNDILWEIWIEGFQKAIQLRPEAWEKLLEAEPETSEATLGMLALTQIVSGNKKDLPQELVETLTRTAPDLIPGWVVTLNNWRIANSRPAPALEQAAMPPLLSKRKVGRNESCPCGSGKKYKRCCGLN